MKNNNIIQSPNPEIDTLRCPKCGAIWRSDGFYEYDLGGWVYTISDCPNGCKSRIFKFPIQGKVIPRNR